METYKDFRGKEGQCYLSIPTAIIWLQLECKLRFRLSLTPILSASRPECGSTLLQTIVDSTKLDPLEFAVASIGRLDAALADVGAKRSYYGARLNQMQTAQRSIHSAVESNSATRSRIQDTDFAHETAELVRHQVLQNSSSAILAQANTVPEQIIELLNSSRLV